MKNVSFSKFDFLKFFKVIWECGMLNMLRPKFTLRGIESFQTMNISPYCVAALIMTRRFEWIRRNTELRQIHDSLQNVGQSPLPGGGRPTLINPSNWKPLLSHCVHQKDLMWQIYISVKCFFICYTSACSCLSENLLKVMKHRLRSCWERKLLISMF